MATSAQPSSSYSYNRTLSSQKSEEAFQNTKIFCYTKLLLLPLLVCLLPWWLSNQIYDHDKLLVLLALDIHKVLILRSSGILHLVSLPHGNNGLPCWAHPSVLISGIDICIWQENCLASKHPESKVLKIYL